MRRKYLLLWFPLLLISCSLNHPHKPSAPEITDNKRNMTETAPYVSTDVPLDSLMRNSINADNIHNR